MKVNHDDIIEQYSSGVSNYKGYTTDLGLWKSEKAIFTKYLKPSDNILDLGCGTGRTRFEDSSFDAVIFSFNGIMSIPKKENRAKAFAEIARVLKSKGTFIFTTHDRDEVPMYFPVWEEQKKIWAKGEQDERLFEYGDLITHSKNEMRDIFVHIPDQTEVKSALEIAGFDLIENFFRPDQFTESEAIKTKSGDCRFWVARRP